MFDAKDEARLIHCLQNGTLNKKHTADEINNLRNDHSGWNRSYAKYMQKNIHPSNVIEQNLTSWFIKYKVQASIGKQSGCGRLDPKTGWALFTDQTKPAIEYAKLKATHITDLDIANKYRIVQPAKKATHGLPIYKSLGSESKMEAFHPVLANFRNTACNPYLAATLVYSGTSQYNQSVRERERELGLMKWMVRVDRQYQII